jgi:hypothetical protein
MRSRGLADARSNGKGILCSPARYPHPIAPLSVANRLSPCALPNRLKGHATVTTKATSCRMFYSRSRVRRCSTEPNSIENSYLSTGSEIRFAFTIGDTGLLCSDQRCVLVPLWPTHDGMYSDMGRLLDPEHRRPELGFSSHRGL